ncbi:MAG: DNA-binding protein WhiA [Oscillospiraceae bacterium]|nr:DNA-binding protein WhiA [Oscillospiraceae bacterium]MDD7355245.1 DNA-binding protein WhiA [Oscillospiraceae bacterium]MDY3937868.1 DNA-binding protein WhiA [Oscillospiraceae bacterium]
MSFSSDVKKEIASIESDDCCKRAMAYGMLLFSKCFSKDDMYIQTEHKYVADAYNNCVKFIIGKEAKITCSPSSKYTVSIPTYEDRMEILHEFGYRGNEISFTINENNIENECCFGAFIRGVFLVCGIVTDPSKEYHLEFDVSIRSKCTQLKQAFKRFPVTPKTAQRNGGYILYFKDSEQIADILALCGASTSMMALIGEKILKDVRNQVNRKVNCENANLQKVCNAASNQISAIRKIYKLKGKEYLPEHLRQIADLRIENPEMTLNELGKSLPEPLTRSGVNHRLKKIEQIANEL